MVSLPKLARLPDDCDRLVQEHWEFVKGIAAFYARRSKMDGDDLFQVGMLGFLSALPNYDPGRGPIKPYMRVVVERAIREYLSHERIHAQVSSLDALAVVDGDNESAGIIWEEMIAMNSTDPQDNPIDAELAYMELITLLRERLMQREFSILALRAGLVDGHIWTFADIGWVFGISRHDAAAYYQRAVKIIRGDSQIAALWRRVIDRTN